MVGSITRTVIARTGVVTRNFKSIGGDLRWYRVGDEGDPHLAQDDGGKLDLSRCITLLDRIGIFTD